MRRHPALPRRTLLAACTACAVAGFAKLSDVTLSARTPTGDGSPHRVLAAVLPNLASAQAIGHAYLAAGRAAEASVERLMWLIFAGQLPSLSTDTNVRAFIGQRLQRDFIDGAVVRVDGWMLSVTEARLCALSVTACS